jgi:hypothetical protein
MQRSRARASSNHAAHGQPAEQGEQGATQGLGHHQLLTGAQPDCGDPAQQVVGQGGHHQPGGVGAEPARRAVPQAHPGFEITDAQLDDCVAAVVGVQPDRGADPVGHKRVVAPVGEQLGLGADQAGATHDQPVTLVAGLGDLARPPLG